MEKMTNDSVETSPQVYARTAGVLYLLIIIFGIFAEAFVRGTTVVPGDGAATAANLMAMESLWRFGIAAEFLSLVCVTMLAMIYYFLLRPVQKELNLLSTFLMLIPVPIQAIAILNLTTALFPIVNAASLKGFTPEQLQTLASLAIRSHGYGFSVALLFVGSHFLIHGYLIFKSGYLPRVLGIMMEVAGVGYVTNSFVLILYPAIASKVFLVVVLPIFLSELSLSLWLLIKGVNIEKWNGRIRMNRAHEVS